MDGDISSPHIVDEIIRKLNFTHALVLTSQNKDEVDISFFEKLLTKTLYRKRFSKAGLAVMLSRKHFRRQGLDKLRSRKDIKQLIVWGDGSIKGIKHSSHQVKSVVYKYKQSWLNLMQ